MKCKQCGNEFEAKRISARFCSGKCRKLAFLSVPEKVSVPEVVSVPVELTLKDDKLEVGIEPVECDLPDYVPDIIREKYLREGVEYRSVIERLVSYSLDELKLMKVWIPCWRHIAEA